MLDLQPDLLRGNQLTEPSADRRDSLCVLFADGEGNDANRSL